MTTYYKDVLQKLDPNSIEIQIKIFAVDSNTNFLSLNLDSIPAIENFLNEVKAAHVRRVALKIPVVSVTINWAEGYSDYVDHYPKTFKSIRDANNFIAAHSDKFPKNGGYDKHNFTVMWADDFENGEGGYTGRLDCKHPSCRNSDIKIGEHISEYMEYLIGEGNDTDGSAQKLLDGYQL